MRWPAQALTALRKQGFLPKSAQDFRSGIECCPHLAVRSGFSSAAKLQQLPRNASEQALQVASLLDRAAEGAADLDPALPGDSLEVLRKENKKLRARLHAMPWPRLTSFMANGQLYPLPLSPDASFGAPSIEHSHLRYLAGFFDGDGCVRYNSSVRGCMLQISQSFDAADVLTLYCSAFGGGIYRLGRGAGLCKPALQWQLAGRKLTRQAASLLSQHSITKEKQLRIAAHWPETRAGQISAVDELTALKRFDSSISNKGSCTWDYVAGLFDADGSISPNGKYGLQLALAQKHITVLEYVRRFLACETGVEITVSRRPHVSQIQVGAIGNCQLIVEGMLKAGLTRKRRQAELVLEYKPENAEAIRTALKSLNGNQRFGKRLDEAGLDRAQDIRKTRSRAGYAAKHGRHSEAASLLKQVEAMKLDHKIKTAQQENFDLREYICKIHGLWLTEAR